MNAKINNEGYLEIERAGTPRLQICPMVMSRGLVRKDLLHKDIPCGDWCPLFGEPYDVKIKSEQDSSILVYKFYIELCSGRILRLKGIEDERKILP